MQFKNVSIPQHHVTSQDSWHNHKLNSNSSAYQCGAGCDHTMHGMHGSFMLKPKCIQDYYAIPRLRGIVWPGFLYSRDILWVAMHASITNCFFILYKNRIIQYYSYSSFKEIWTQQLSANSQLQIGEKVSYFLCPAIDCCPADHRLHHHVVG